LDNIVKILAKQLCRGLTVLTGQSYKYDKIYI